jgi:hypothetical protein
MAEEIHLAEPKLVPLNEAEQAEAVGLLAALLRAAIASRATACERAVRGDRRGATTARETAGGEPPAPGRHPTGAQSKAVRPVAATLPLARRANGKRTARERAGEKA